MSATEFYEIKFGEKPQTDQEKLMAVMMSEYAEPLKKIVQELFITHIVDVDENGEPNKSIKDLMSLWEKAGNLAGMNLKFNTPTNEQR
jgi:hypothetical protein